jgi:hypothetical protein
VTLPFRRRHHDIDTPHERARALGSIRMDEDLAADDAAWLGRHLADCRECEAAIADYGANRTTLRAAGANHPEAPRDLWARTAAAIERESAAHRGDPVRRPATATGPDSHPRPSGRRFAPPMGIVAGTLVVLVVVGASLLQGGLPVGPVATGSALASVSPAATPIAVTTSRLGYVRSSSDGRYSLFFAQVDSVCPAGDSSCGTLGADGTPPALVLDEPPAAVVVSPTSEQVVIVPAGTGSGSILIVPVSSPTASPTPVAPGSPSTRPSATPPGTETPGPSSQPSPLPTPAGAVSILDGVTIVGDVVYSPDGSWLAFSARPLDGSAGPDVYAWHVGEPHAVQLTTDHRSVFSDWVGTMILASRVDATSSDGDLDGILGGPPTSTEPPTGASSQPTATPVSAASASPAASAEPTPGSEPGASTEPSASTGPDAEPQLGATAFVVDPTTGIATDLPGLRAWRPVVDPTSRSVVYWSGGLVPTPDGVGWTLGRGAVVLDRWSPPAELGLPGPSASPDAAGSASPSPVASSVPAASPSATGSPSPGQGKGKQDKASPTPTAAPTTPIPASASPSAVATPGQSFPVDDLGRVTLSDGALTGFDAHFDPTGTRLALWASDADDPSIGRLHLFVLDPASGALTPTAVRLDAVPAMRGFSIALGRLAWVTPPGQDGQDSTVQVLAWTNDAFGRVSTNPGRQLLIVH